MTGRGRVTPRPTRMNDSRNSVLVGCRQRMCFAVHPNTTMNSALFHAARPGDIRSGGLGGGAGGETRSGMREAAAVAKEMGFGQDFGPQVGYRSYLVYLFYGPYLVLSTEYSADENMQTHERAHDDANQQVGWWFLGDI